MLLVSNLSQLSEAALRKLCDDRCPESNSLDFKRELTGSSDKDKQELLKDVCSFANTEGGDLVYGLAEQDGVAAALAPLSGELPDAAKRRISQVLDAGLEPRVHGIEIHHVEVTGGFVLIVRVPASFDGPHCLRINNVLRRFVMRNGTSTTDLTFDQLRTAFDRTATLAERARRLIDSRVELLTDHKESKPLIEGAVCVVHLVPIAGLAGRHAVDLRALHEDGFARFIHDDWGGCSRTFNFDGLVVHPSPAIGDGRHYGYIQVFRTGAMEAAGHAGAERDVNGQDRLIVWPQELVKFYRDNVSKFISALKEWGISGPAVLRFALLHVGGFELPYGGAYRRFSGPLRDRQHLALPEVWIENLDSADLDGVVRPMMDMVWQAFGVPRCSEFDIKSGAYAPGR